MITGVDSGEICVFNCSFCYDQYKPPKRTKVIDTEKGSYRETSIPLIKHGTHTFKFNYKMASCSERNKLDELFESGEDLIFNGNMGEEYLVEFVKCEPIRKNPAVFEIRGEFRVICVEIPADACVTCTEVDPEDNN